MDIEFTKETRFMGRNGSYKCKGMYIAENVSTIDLCPITSKGEVGNCYITIPKEDIAKFIEKLQEYGQH